MMNRKVGGSKSGDFAQRGEFIWFVVGAVIGAYVTGAKANGSFNPLKWDWKATGGQILLGAAFGAISGGVGAIAGGSAAAFAASSLGIQGGVLGGAIAGLAGGAVGGAIGGLGNSIVFGESIGRGIVRGMVAGAIGGAVIGGVLGGIQTGLQNPKLPAGEKLNMITGNKVAAGRGVWSLNNTPKTTTVGKIGRLEVGMPEGEIIRNDYNPNLNNNTTSNPESLKPVNFGKTYDKLGTVIERPEIEITGFTKHGINQVITRGVTPENILGTINNPNVVLQQTRGYLYLSREAGIVINLNGKIVTAYPSSMFDKNIWSILSGH